MPYKLPFFEKYTLDYNQLFQEIRENSHNTLFSQNKTTDLYIRTFLNLMQQADIKMGQAFLDTAIEKELRSYYFENQVFQQPIHFSKQDIFLHFRVSEILTLLNEEETDISVNIPTTHFLGEYAKYHWSTPDNQFCSTSNSVPVIAVPYLWGYQDWLVIDGNHRIQKALKTATTIPVAHVDANALIDLELFASDFEKFFYIFHCDSCILANLKRDYSLSDEELLERSYIKTLKLNFAGML